MPRQLPETGKAPTEEEFTVAKRRGIPIRVVRKRGISLEAEQEAFVKRIEAYSTGVFRNAFSNATELLADVARVIRELENAPTVFHYDPLATPLAAP